jgi:hypothetical protein
MTGAMKVLKDSKKTDYVGEMSMETQRLTIWDFANLIIDHNLEDYLDPKNPEAGTRRLDFKNMADVQKLSSKVGDEVGTYIDKLNTFDEDEEGNSAGRSGLE